MTDSSTVHATATIPPPGASPALPTDLADERTNNNEDSTAGVASEKQDLARRGPSLLDLPDEALTLIFEHLLPPIRPDDPVCAGAGLARPVSLALGLSKFAVHLPLCMISRRVDRNAVPPHTLLKHISFRNYHSVEWWESETQLPSVAGLVMEEQPDWHHKDNHKSIAPFLAMFLSLRTFHLSCAGFLPSSAREAILAASPLDPSLPDPASFVRGGRKPKTRWDGRKLKVLVDRVQKSEVLGFRFKVQADAPVELRFTREAARETFEAEWWWL
ncbi:hypothetical protein JCM10207_000223 [Rhodosporidiobolus poonsookiae]